MMKSAILIFLLPAIVLFGSACEKHDISELAKIEVNHEEHEEHEGHGGSEAHGHSAPAAHGEAAAESGHGAASASSPAPNFFSR